MSGDIASKTQALTQTEKKKERLEEYEGSLGLPTLKRGLDQCDSMNLSGEDISSLTPEDRDEHAANLAAYAIYIQRTLSKERALARWLESKISLSIADELNNYAGYYSHDQRRAIAIKGNAYAKELEEFRMNSQLKVDLLEGLTYQINQLCRVLQNNPKKMSGANSWQG